MNLLLSIFILFLFSLANSKELTYSDLQKREGLYYYGITDIPYTGKILGLTKGSFVKGKKEGVHIFTVLNEPFNYLKHESFLSHYKKRDWVKALVLVSEIINDRSPLEFYYKMMKERILELEQNDPGPDWDKVYRATSK